MPVRYNSSISGFSPRSGLLDIENCVCICDADQGCCHENEMKDCSKDESVKRDLPKASSPNVSPNFLFNSSQLAVPHSCLYSGSRFSGSQISKGSSYQVEVIFQVCLFLEKKYRECLFTNQVHLECRRSKFIFMWLSNDKGTHGRVPNNDDIF